MRIAWMTVFMTAVFGCIGSGAQEQACTVDQFSLGPVPAAQDLRTMVRCHLVRQSCALLEQAAAKRKAAFDAGAWQAWRDGVRQRVRAALGEMRFGADGPPLNVRAVSRHALKGCAVENVLFESLPGWDVNASVFLPDAAAFPPPWPAIVVPVGHSGKQMADYQIPAQFFARCGYVAVLFDPPGMAGEKQGGNDHFIDGVRCYLTGHSSNRYFVLDALRCVDYLATRPDVDMRHGVGMTGVSGGGTTTTFAALLDERIAAAGPACCAVPTACHPIIDVYAPCAETLPWKRFADGYDDVDLLAAALPTPVLLMAGERDEVFKIDWSNQIAATVTECFKKAQSPERFRYFADAGGHGYSVTMARQFALWMDRWIRDTPGRIIPEFGKDDIELADPKLLQCKPRLDVNMFTVNRDLAAVLHEKRSGLDVREAAKQLCGVTGVPVVPTARLGAKTLVWFHWLQEAMLQTEPDIELPVSFLYPAREGWKGGAVLYFDDRGRWSDLRGQGPLTVVTHFTERDTDGPAILTVDLRGWGDTASADMPYDLAGWADRSRWTAYVSAAAGDPILAMRIRDGLAALAWLRSRGEIDPARIVVGGHGMGGIVALHVAAIDGQVAGAFSLSGLGSFESLAASEKYVWSHEDFLPGVLLHYDLPELVNALPMPVLIANPLDAEKKPLDAEAVAKLYPPCDGLTAAQESSGQMVRFVAGVMQK